MGDRCRISARALRGTSHVPSDSSPVRHAAVPGEPPTEQRRSLIDLEQVSRDIAVRDQDLSAVVVGGLDQLEAREREPVSWRPPRSSLPSKGPPHHARARKCLCCQGCGLGHRRVRCRCVAGGDVATLAVLVNGGRRGQVRSGDLLGSGLALLVGHRTGPTSAAPGSPDRPNGSGLAWRTRSPTASAPVAILSPYCSNNSLPRCRTGRRSAGARPGSRPLRPATRAASAAF